MFFVKAKPLSLTAAHLGPVRSMPRSITFGSIALLTCLSSAVIAAENDPPEELYSADKRYSVRILHSVLPGADPYDGFFTIAVRSGQQYIAKYPTIGFLLDAFWSPNGKYVAVDNRRANSGDYLWVFRLSDGRALRMPVDAVLGHPEDAYEKFAEDLVQRVTRKLPELTCDEFRKLFTFGKGWTESGDLLIKTNFAFRNLPGDQVAILLQTFKIADDKLVLIDDKADKAPWPPKT
jgi:hypothetical protein